MPTLFEIPQSLVGKAVLILRPDRDMLGQVVGVSPALKLIKGDDRSSWYPRWCPYQVRLLNGECRMYVRDEFIVLD